MKNATARQRGGQRCRVLALLALITLAASQLACGTVKSPTDPEDGGGGSAPPFSQLQAEIFTPSCAEAGCHVASVAAGGLVLDAGASFANLVNQRSLGNSTLDRVEPGDPERSYLIKKLRGDPDISGGRMPFDGPPYLNPAQIEQIAAWIRSGAPNN